MSRPPDSKDTATQDDIQDVLTPAQQSNLALATAQNITPHHENVRTSHLQSLPVELQLEIFDHLNPCTSLCLGLTNKYFYSIHWELHGSLPLRDSRIIHSIEFPESSPEIVDAVIIPSFSILVGDDHPSVIPKHQIRNWRGTYLQELFGAYMADLKQCKSRHGCGHWRYELRAGWKDVDVLMLFIPPGMWHKSFFKACRAVLNTILALPIQSTADGAFSACSSTCDLDCSCSHLGVACCNWNCTCLRLSCTCDECCNHCCPACNQSPDPLRQDILLKAYMESISSVDWMENNREPISFCDFSQVLSRIWDSLHNLNPSCLLCTAFELVEGFDSSFDLERYDEWTPKLRNRTDYGQDMSGAWSQEIGVVAQQYIGFHTYYKSEEHGFQEGWKWGAGFQRIVNRDDVWDMMQDWGDKNLGLKN